MYIQNEQLMNGLNAFYLASYPPAPPAVPINNGVAPGGYSPADALAHKQNQLMKYVVIGGLIFLICYHVNYYIKAYRQAKAEDRESD